MKTHNLIGCHAQQRIVIGSGKLYHCQTWLKQLLSSSNELRNPQILKKMLEKSSQFLSPEQPCEPKSLGVALNIAGAKRIFSENLWLRSTQRPFDSSYIKQIDSMLPYVCSVIDHSRRQNIVRILVTLGYRLVCYFFVLTHFDVICDLLLNRRTATWNLFVKIFHHNSKPPLPTLASTKRKAI